MSKTHNRYSLNVDSTHMETLLDSLYGYQSEIDDTATEEQKFIIADLIRRAELLDSLCRSGKDFYEAQRAYRTYCRYGDKPSDSQ